MVHQVLEIPLDYARLGLPEVENARLYTYVMDNSPDIDPDRRRPTVLILPGGGYQMTSDREAEPVAMRLCAMGFQCFVLRYTTPALFCTALLQAMASVKLIRERAEEWHVDPGKIAVMGFSAGGHLAASLGCLSRPDFCGQYGVDHKLARPDGMILCYPVISAGPFRHQGSFDHLLGDKYDELIGFVSLENQVTASTPPAFLWHTVEDAGVPVENSLLFANALQKEKIPFELHIYPKGPHGLSLCNEETASKGSADQIQPGCQGWIDLAGAWLRAL